MTRTEQFDANVKEPLLQMNNEVENLDLANLDDAQRLELTRAKKVLVYVLNYINLLDPDLLPQTFFNQIQAKTQAWNKTIPHLNQTLDDILFYLASYGSIYIPKNQASSTIAEMVKSYGNVMVQSLLDINLSKANLDESQKQLEEHKTQLKQYENDQKTKIKNIEDKIRELLSDATNARLGSSYEKSKNSYRWIIVGWNALFFFIISIIVGIAIWGFVSNGEANNNQPLAIFSAIFERLPFYIPLAWLGYFATQRRNEAKRLQEEYKYKEVLARSFLGHKDEIRKIEGGQDENNLMKQLMENLIKTSAQNPNETLDKVKKENTYDRNNGKNFR